MNILQLSTAELAYLDRGAGLPIVLLHGFPLDHTMWSAQIDALAGDYRIIAPDLRGFGRSQLGAAHPERGITMDEYADDVAELLDKLGIDEPIVLVGFSMGGYIAWQFLRKFADRVRALVQCDTKAAADTDEARANRHKMADNVAQWGAPRIAEMIGPTLLAQQTFDSRPQAVATIRRVVGSSAPEAIAAAQRGMAIRPDMTSLLPKITVPTLVVVGQEDGLSPPQEMRGIADAIPNAQFVEIPAAGHMTTVENPAAVNEAILNFLKRLP